MTSIACLECVENQLSVEVKFFGCLANQGIGRRILVNRVNVESNDTVPERAYRGQPDQRKWASLIRQSIVLSSRG